MAVVELKLRITEVCDLSSCIESISRFKSFNFATFMLKNEKYLVESVDLKEKSLLHLISSRKGILKC